MKMKKYKYFVSIIAIIFSVVSLTKADSPAPPWSKVIPSSSGKYVLVLISSKVKEQEEYIARQREFWRTGGIPAENVPEAEKALNIEIDNETAIRKKYPESGLYTAAKSPKLLWRTDFYDLLAWVKISDDAEHMIVGKWAISPIFEERPSEANPEVKEVIRVYPNMEDVILTFYSFGKPLRSYKASELTTDEEKFRNNSEVYFIWSDEGILNEKTKTLSITKTNGEKLVFDMSGNLVSGKLPRQQNSTSKSETNNLQPPKSENIKSFCGGTILPLGLTLLLSFGRETSRKTKAIKA
jgi:hypothetical protein